MKFNIIKFLLWIFIILELFIIAVFIFESSYFHEEMMDGFCKDCNIVIISIDTLRADHVGIYGYNRNTTPYIDTLASESVVFKKAFSQAPSTVASHMTLFTSLYPPIHNVCFYPDLLNCTQSLSSSHFLLAELLSFYNYSTGGFIDEGLMSSIPGFSRGFDTWIEYQSYFNQTAHLLESLDWIKNNSNEKFFLFFHTYVVHDPYAPPSNFKKWSDNNSDIYSSFIELEKDMAIFNLTDRELFWKNVSREDLNDRNQVIALYDEEILYADKIVESIVLQLKELGIYNNTIIIITSDHGEEFWEHNGILHWKLFNEILHVPLIIKIPKFENVIASAPLTFISLPMMISSSKPFLSSFSEPSDEHVFILNNQTTITKSLKNNSFKTISIMNNDITYTNLLKDFDSKEVFDFEDDSLITAKAIDYLSSFNQQKFFLWIHYISPHSPYKPANPYDSIFYKDDLYNFSKLFPVKEVSEFVNLNFSDGNFYISQYDGEIKFIDNEIKKLWTYLEENNLSKNTLIIISSDHDESLGEHNSFFDHSNCYESDLKIPLIIYNPKSHIKNKRITQQISNIDFYPTILDILKITDKPVDLIGKSFYNLIIGIYQKERVAWSILNKNYFSYRTNDWKIIFDLKGTPQLYNLKSDPNELNNLFENYSSLKSKMNPDLVKQIDKVLSE